MVWHTVKHDKFKTKIIVYSRKRWEPETGNDWNLGPLMMLHRRREYWRLTEFQVFTMFGRYSFSNPLPMEEMEVQRGQLTSQGHPAPDRKSWDSDSNLPHCKPSPLFNIPFCWCLLLSYWPNLWNIKDCDLNPPPLTCAFSTFAIFCVPCSCRKLVRFSQFPFSKPCRPLF